MCIDSYADISIHTPTRGTTAGTGTATNLAEFQSTFPREERPYYTIVRIQVLQFQSTLPREERRRHVRHHLNHHLYFNPRSHERSDAIQMRQHTQQVYFNPRSHERSDIVAQSVSEYIRNFNPRSHERSDLLYDLQPFTAPLFQSTLPREERRMYYIYISMICVYFNPRSHERSDRYNSSH